METDRIRAYYECLEATLSEKTIVSCCNAEGSYIPPMIIFKGTRKPTIESLPPGSLIEVFKSGWIDKELFLACFRHFIQHLPHRIDNERIALVMDGHTSHESVALFDEANKNNVDILGLPSHTSNYLQPLDISIYGPFKRSWRERCRIYMDRNPGSVANKDSFYSILF